MAKVFFSYSHDDEAHRDRLEKHLALLKRQGLIDSWHDRRILAGSEVDAAISAQLETADVILLLVSASFIASDYCYSREMSRALERHSDKNAVVIPIIVSPCDWHRAPFGKLLAAPKDGKPIVLWANVDEAYADVARQVRAVVESLGVAAAKPQAEVRNFGAPAAGPAPAAPSFPRSSNLRVKKEFTQRDKDAFLHDGFEYMARFFEGSLQELGARNAGIEGLFRRIDGNTFTAKIYQNGASASECVVRLGGISRDNGITFCWDASSGNNSFNEMLSIEVDDQGIHFRPMGMQFSRAEKNLSHEGAAEFFWGMLIGRLQ